MNGDYRVVVPTSVTRAMARLPKQRQAQLRSAIDSLTKNPRPAGCVKLSGHENLWRIRVGTYRIVYAIHDNRRAVINCRTPARIVSRIVTSALAPVV